MNIFLPEESVVDSIQALDNKRLVKQILECKTILDVALDKNKKGYAKHPVVAYYSKYPEFVTVYGKICCNEYQVRFGKEHKLYWYFLEKWLNRDEYFKKGEKEVPEPFYCEGLKTDPKCIRTTENTVELFRNKLCKKWDNDKYPPKWTNREVPVWYKNNRFEKPAK